MLHIEKSKYYATSLSVLQESAGIENGQKNVVVYHVSNRRFKKVYATVSHCRQITLLKVSQ